MNESLALFLCWTGQWQAAAGEAAVAEATASVQSWLGMLDLVDASDRISLTAIVCQSAFIKDSLANHLESRKSLSSPLKGIESTQLLFMLKLNSSDFF